MKDKWNKCIYLILQRSNEIELDVTTSHVTALRRGFPGRKVPWPRSMLTNKWTTRRGPLFSLWSMASKMENGITFYYMPILFCEKECWLCISFHCESYKNHVEHAELTKSCKDCMSRFNICYRPSISWLFPSFQVLAWSAPFYLCNVAFRA